MLKLKDNFQSEIVIYYEIKSSTPANPFSIFFTVNNKRYLIQEIFDDSDEALYETLNKIYKLLDGKDIIENSE